MNKHLYSALLLLCLFSCGSNTHQTQTDIDSTEQALPAPEPETPKLTDEELKAKFEKILRMQFGKMAKVTKWGDTFRWPRNNSMNIEGEVSAVVRGDKAIYDFSAAIKENGLMLDYLQMHHKGTFDYFYNCTNNVRLDDETYKSQFKFKGIKLTVLGMRESAIRYITSRKMNRNQIMEFIIGQTDMKRSNYYFQLSETKPEYATYIGDENERLCKASAETDKPVWSGYAELPLIFVQVSAIKFT